MFYHALTGNGGTTPTEDLEPVLLWTNSNPTVAFTPQKVTLDLTNYAGVIIELIQSKNLNELASRVYFKKTDDFSKLLGSGFRGNEGNSHARNILKVDNTGVEFGNDGGSNIVVIPYKIYGVKEYVVEPQIGDLLWTNPAPTAGFGAQKISVDLSNAKGVIIECMISYNTQMPKARTLINKGETPFGIGYTTGTTPTSRNVTAVEDDGVTFATAYSGTSEATTALIPYKIYAIN